MLDGLRKQTTRRVRHARLPIVTAGETRRIPRIEHNNIAPESGLPLSTGVVDLRARKRPKTCNAKYAILATTRFTGPTQQGTTISPRDLPENVRVTEPLHQLHLFQGLLAIARIFVQFQHHHLVSGAMLNLIRETK